MAKVKISDFSATPASNTDIDGINLAEGCAPSGINDAIRELMAQLKDFQTGAAGDSFNGPVGTSTAAAGAFTTLTASSTATLNTLASSGATLTGGTINNMAVGGTTAAAVSATTLTTSSTVTHNGGTANGVAYLDGSKVLTTGSALTFDGTNFLLASGGRIRNIPTTTTANALFQSSNDGGGFYTGIEDSTGSLFTGAAYAGLVWHTGNRPIAFGVNNAEQMRLTSTGLGIGTSSPARKLDVLTSASGNIANFGTTAAGGQGLLIAVDTTAKLTQLKNNTDADYGMAFYSGNGVTERMRLDSSGNLGLGVTPSAWAGGYKAFEVNAGSIAATAGAGNVIVSNNAFLDGTNWIYKATGTASDYVQTGGQHWWRTAASGTAGNAISFTQAMTLTDAGRLLLGVTSAVSANRIDAISDTNAVLQARSSSAGSGDGTSTVTVTRAVNSAANDWANARYDAFAHIWYSGTGSSSERARITSGGYFKASNTGTYQSSTSTYHELRNDANANTVRISNTIASGYTDAIIQVAFPAYAPNTTNSWFLFCDDSTTNRVQLRSNGGIANYSANDVNLSDRREKTNFAPAGSYLEKICAIPVQTFNYIDQNLEDDGGLTLGVVAQDVQAIAPELVMESNWAKQGDEPKMRLSIYQTDLQYALMKCIQEQQALINSLKARLDAANL
jgi:hypothetical protein